VVALTMQILVCVALLLAAGTLKKVDGPGFARIKGQYSSLTTGESQMDLLGALASGWSQGADSIISSVERTVNSFISRIMGNGIEEETSQESDAFSYNYLRAEPEGGVGGLFPVEVRQSENGQMAPPSGSTLAPVILGGKIIAPVEGLITSDFAYRIHPITETTDFHNGMDVAAEEGRNILAALPGEVTEVGWSEVYGNYIILKHATHLETFYAHCSEILAEEGMVVRQGERIAKVGQTGMATGPHLHFSVIVDGEYTDPAWVLGDLIQVVE